MRKYDDYKDSGIEWISKIPKHWEIKKFKYVNKPKYGFPLNAALFSDTENEGFPIIRIRDLQENKCETFYQGEIINDALVSDGDVLISMDGDFHLVQWLGGTAMLNQRICKVLSTEKLLKEFYFYLAAFPLQIIHDLKFYTTVKHLSDPDLKDMEISLPPLEEQSAIVSYLDNKTTEIDQTIADKEALINLFEEEKKALINEAVTKGLNPKVKLKPSGVDWLGDIPEHWEVKKLKYVTKSIQTGKTPPTSNEEYFLSEDYDWFTPGDFGSNMILANSNRKISQLAVDEEGLKLFEPSTVLLVAIGATLGKIGIVTDFCFSNQQINSITFNSAAIIPFFGAYFLESNSETIKKQSVASTLAMLNQEKTKELLITVPPIKEQSIIVQHIETETSNINEKINLTKQEIELLKEYRQALIFEAVTGKICVL